MNIVVYLLLVNNTLTAYPDGDKHDNDGVSVSVSCGKYKTILNMQNAEFFQGDINEVYR